MKIEECTKEELIYIINRLVWENRANADYLRFLEEVENARSNNAKDTIDGRVCNEQMQTLPSEEENI